MHLKMRMKSKVLVALLCGIVIVMTSFLTASGDPGGTILLRLNSLENKNQASGCCSACASQCNYQLEIWVTCDNKKIHSNCLYGHSKTGIFSSSSNIIFDTSLGNGLWNPLAYNFSLFHGTFGLQIFVTNQSEVKIDDYTYHIGLYPKSNSTKKWTNVNKKAQGASESRLNLTYSVSCNEHYYGPSCVVGCIPGKTYRCDKTSGNKICINGWIGALAQCNCRQSLQNNCDATGKKLCHPTWFGENCDVKCTAKNDGVSGYSCNNRTGSKICLNSWYGNECNLRTPQLGSSIISSHSLNSTTISASEIWQTASLSSTLQEPSRHFNHVSSKNHNSYIHTATAGKPSSSSVVMSLQSTSNLVNPNRILETTSLPPEMHLQSSNDVASQTRSLHPSREISLVKRFSKQLKSSKSVDIERTVKLALYSSTVKLALYNSTFSKPHPISTSGGLQSVTMVISAVKSRTDAIGASVEHTEKSKFLPQTTLSGIEPKPSTSSDRVTQTSSVGDSREIEPGSSETRTQQDVWWMVLLPFTLITLLITAAGLVIFKYKRRRKSNEISPSAAEDEMPLEETCLHKDSNKNQDNNKHQNKTKDDKNIKEWKDKQISF